MRRTQLCLDEEVWRILHERARESGVTISELVRRAIQDRYVVPAEERRKAMRAFIGIREDNPEPTDTDAYIRRLRKSAGEFMRQFARSHSVELGDALVAATTVRYDALLWTRNRKHNPMRELRFF